MINIVYGDLLEASEDVIVHQVNCRGKMNSGVAKQIREKFPTAYKDYMIYFKDSPSRSDLLGEVRFSMVKSEVENKYIAHLFGQSDYGYDGKRYTSYDALCKGLLYIKKICKDNNRSIAMPYMIGSDRGGADWDVVYIIIEKIFKDYDVTLYKLD